MKLGAYFHRYDLSTTARVRVRVSLVLRGNMAKSAFKSVKLGIIGKVSWYGVVS